MLDRCYIAARDRKREMFLVGGTNRTHVVKYDVEIGKDLSFLQVQLVLLPVRGLHNAQELNAALPVATYMKLAITLTLTSLD